MALGFLLTTRGIPQLYYGTEILMDEAFDWSNHDKVRMEFPGGWPGDKVNKFEASGRTAAEQVAFDYLRTLARYRRSSPALTAGSLTQFVPEEGIYVYFRQHESQTVMVIMNQNASEKPVAPARFAEILDGFSSGRDIFSEKIYSLDKEIRIKGTGILVLELLP